VRVHLHVPADPGTPLPEVFDTTRRALLDRLCATGYVPVCQPVITVEVLPGGLLATAHVLAYAPPEPESPSGGFPGGYDPVVEAERLLREAAR